MPRPEELRLTQFASDDSDYEEDIFNSSIIHRYEKKQPRCTRTRALVGTMLLIAVLVTTLAIVGATLFPGSKPRCQTETGLLPQNIQPLHYDLWIHPNLTSLTFKAKVEIFLQVDEPTQCIVLHSLNQSIQHIKLKLGDGSELITEPHYVDTQHEFLVIPLRARLSVGSYVLVIHYNATIRHALKGFYRSYYTTANGKQRVAAVTQFEATFARHAFPCFDEPAFKATFTISIVREDRHTALSNMPVNSTAKLDNGLLEDRFEKSVKMSTYLVAFIIMDFNNRTATTKNGKQIRIWSREETHHQTEYALDCAVKIMENYEEMFGIAFPLPKQDLVAVPDFNSGAMENWGLITYRETSILYDAAETSNAFKRRVVTVVAHEMAHQWFGNLVTMKWWNDLWLNEGFASYMEYVASDKIEPGMKMMMYLQTNGMQRALSDDSFSNSHPISTEANNPVQIAEMFDAISYRKGACIIRMCNEVLGNDRFFKGIQTYLTKYSYSNTVQKQLYSTLNEYQPSRSNGPWSDLNPFVALFQSAKGMQPAVDVDEFMNSWTLQMGYPVVTITKSRSRTAKISQAKYSFDNDAIADSPYGYKWLIPFWYETSSLKNQMVWLNSEKGEISIEEGDEWILGNSGSKGFYRVNYDTKGWEDIIRLLETRHTDISAIDRMKILDDMTSLSQMPDGIDATLALRASTYLKQEESLYTVTGSLTSLSRILGKVSVIEKYKPALDRYYITQLDPVVNRLGMSGYAEESFEDGLLRGSILSAAANHGHKECIDNAQQLFNNHLNTGQEVDPNLYSYVYETVAINCTEEVWDKILNEYTSESLQSKQRYLMKALASTTNPNILRRLLGYTMNEEKVRRQDARILLMYISMGSYQGNTETWNFLRENWDYFFEIYGNSNSGFDLLIESVVGQFHTKEDIDEVTKFFANKSNVGSSQKGLLKGMEAANHRRAWLGKHGDKAGQWLEDNYPADR